MSRFEKLSHVLWHCQYHFVWVPKYRYRVLDGQVKQEVDRCIRIFCDQMKCQIVELNIQQEHIHLLVKIPPRISVSDTMGTLKGRTAIRIFKSCPNLKERPYWGNHFWAPGYCVDTVGLNSEMIQKYVQYQDRQERQGRLPFAE